ncbi:MAG: trypsin-like peptidase domain-containing protein [Betaproteobacteria bacterium]
MKKVALYSRSPPPRRASPPAVPATPRPSAPATAQPQGVEAGPARGGRLRRGVERHERVLFMVAGALFAFAIAAVYMGTRALPRELTQKDIDASVLHTLETAQIPSVASKAFEAVRPSVVRVIGLGAEPDPGEGNSPASRGGFGIGTGVVVVDKGTILTNLHVVAGADKVKVEFYDGLIAEATVIGTRPEHDLAVLQAKTIPDDLVAATLRSTADLAVGDEVVAVGFPFGIGPSASSGIVSGLRREYQSPEGKRLLTNLIQFDAAANPGNSGGPLVTAGGEVVGIVTAILNPSEQRVFIGIGFAVPIENAAAAVGISPF